MNLSVHYPPHIRSRDSSTGLMFDVMVAMMPLYGMAVYFYGPRAAALGFLSAAVCLVTDHICSLVLGRGINLRDISSAVTGFIIALLMPASASYKMVAYTGVFAILVVKQLFGGLGQNVFNPAAGGFAFAAFRWPEAVFNYPPPFITLPLTPVVETAAERSAAYALKLGTAHGLDYVDLALGNISGPMGATHALVLLGCMCYLWVRRSVKPGKTLGFLAGAAVIALLFPRSGLAPVRSVFYELMSGSLMFAAIFMLSDPVTSPKRPISRLVYGFLGGMSCMVCRHIGRFEESVVFAILVMNSFVWILDTEVEQIYRKHRRERHAQINSEDLSKVQS